MFQVTRSEFVKTIRQFLATIKRLKGCKYCEERHPACLDFHHRDDEVKFFTISELASRGSWLKIEAEVAKCDVVCANCHRKHHYEEGSGAWRLGRRIRTPLAVKMRAADRAQQPKGESRLQTMKQCLATGPKNVRWLSENVGISPAHVRVLVSRNKTIFTRVGRTIQLAQ